MGSANPPRLRVSKPEDEVVFSMRGEDVWVSWPHTNAAVRLGTHEAVAAMMRDYLGQSEIANQLLGLRAAR
jgi:hypothetical protein